MALITIFSASVSAHAMSGGTFVDWQIVDTILNLEYSSTNCKVVFFNSDTPNVDWTDSFGRQKFQKTTYGVMTDMYETLTVYGASLSANAIFPQVYDWFEYNGHCFIRITVESNITGSVNDKFWVANGSGKILYCDAPADDGYTVSGIAGTSTYFITPRPVGTAGNGYLGDLYIARANYNNIKSTLNNLGGATSYYTILFSVNGETRYYLATAFDGTRYYVCNSAGQLFYTLKEDPPVDDDTGGGSTFDPTEVITAINSVYDAILSMNSNLATRIINLRASVDAIGTQFGMHMDNTVFGFESIGNQLTTLNGYFSDLSGLFPVQEEITLLGSNTRVAWDSADRITGVKTSGFNGDLIVKERTGPLVDESGYENVKLSPDTTEYRLYNDDDGYRRIVAANAYPDTGSPIPEGTFCYFSFDDTLSSSVGNLAFTANGSPQYANGVDGKAFLFNGATDLQSNSIVSNYGSGPFTVSVWLYIPRLPTSLSELFSIRFGNVMFGLSVTKDGYIRYIDGGSSLGWVNGNISIPLNHWFHVAMTFDGGTSSGIMRGFVNGVLDANITTDPLTPSSPIYIRQSFNTNGADVFSGTMIDEFLFVDGRALWISNFDPYTEAIFSAVAADYFLPCTDQTIGLVFDDTINQTLTPTDVNGNAITMGRLEDDFSEIYMDITSMQWYCHDPQTQTEILLSSANQQIMNDTIYVRQNYTMLPADQITADALQNLLPVDAPVYLDMPEGAKIIITYDHYSGWFRAMYILMDKQNQLLNDLDIVNETIINVENTVVDITQDNDAYHIFYITKTDGTTESVGDAAKDAAVFIGDVLSMFYRLVFEDALDNVDILNDFESAYSNTEVSVW